MKKILFLAAWAFAINVHAQQIKTPAPSPTQTIKQDFAIGSIELSYSRPSAKGRKIFGDLVPFDKVWRTGANAATTISFSDDVSIDGKAVKAGKYGLLSIPGEKSWTLIITKDLNVNSPSLYKQENDVVRFTAPVIKMSESVETFTMQFAALKNNSCELHIMWDKTAVALPISTDVDAKVMAQIDNAMNKDNKPYFNAASYYYDNGKDLDKAAQWVDKAIEANPKAFWIYLLKARINEKLGNKVVAKAAAEQCISLATEQKNDDYIKMGKELLGKL